MQMQPYQPQDLAAASGERIHVPMMGPAPGAHGPAAQPPSLVSVFVREAWTRKKLLFIWLGVTAVVTAAVVLKFAQPLYRAEGKLAYQPNYSRGPKPIYTPPNIQSAVQILKSAETLDPVRVRHLPNLSADEFGKSVRVEVSKQSEFIDVSYDHPDPVVAAAVANDLMEEGLKAFNDVRLRTTKDAVVQVRKDLQTAKKRLEEAKEVYRKAHEAHGISDVQVELVTVQTGLADVNRQIRSAHEQESRLKAQIQELEKRRDAPADANVGLDETFFPTLQAQMAKLQNELNNMEKLDTARISLASARRKEGEYRGLLRKGAVTRAEYEEVATQVQIHEATIKRAEQTQADYDELKKQYDQMKKNMASGKPVRRAVIEELDRLKAELAGIPVALAALTAELGEKKKALSDLAALQKELGPMDEEVHLLRTRVQDFDAQLTDAAERSQDLNANDLRIHNVAAAGTAPYSTNAPKLGLALFGTSGLLFVGYIGLFALPRLSPGAMASAPTAPPGGLPRALVALVPYLQPAKQPPANGTPTPPASAPTVHATAGPNGSAPDNEPVTAWGDAVGVPAKPPSKTARRQPAAPPPEPPRPADPDPAPVQVLAERIAEDGVDRGGIVLFTPTADELRVAPAMGDLGRFFTERGDRVLVFDARHGAETPTWAGPNAPVVAETVEGFLDGRAEGASGCFVPTDLNGVEYSRADLSTRVGGVMAAHRFRQLVEEMRERYSVVFLVGPTVSLEGGDPLLATLAEGMVLVTEMAADPTDVHAYLETLSHHTPARVYGTLAVPRA